MTVVPRLHPSFKHWLVVRLLINKGQTTFSKCGLSLKIYEKNLDELWRKFPDSSPLMARAKAHRNNGDMQPNAPKGSMGLFAAPAFYDWIDVSLTLTEQQELPSIAVYPWKAPED